MEEWLGAEALWFSFSPEVEASLLPSQRAQADGILWGLGTRFYVFHLISLWISGGSSDDTPSLKLSKPRDK